jgi:hypothetical protein
MIWKILLWGSLIYIVCVVIWRLFIALTTIIEGYAEKGWAGAVRMAIVNFFFNVWDLAKFAFTVLILVLIVRGCRH